LNIILSVLTKKSRALAKITTKIALLSAMRFFAIIILMFGARILLELFLTFFKIGAVTFGGGLAMLPILDRELCQKKGWVSQDELIDYYAVGQATPGIIAVNVATFCGHKLKGSLGGAVATLAVVAPSVIVISLLASWINTIDQVPVIKKALMGVNVAVAANMSFSIIKLFKKTVVSVLALFLFAAAFCLIFFFKANVVLVIFCAALLGCALYFVSEWRNKRKRQNAAASNDSGLATDKEGKE